MLMKYNDFKKMTANEMKEVKGGTADYRGQLVASATQGPYCIAEWATPGDCCTGCVVVGNCPTNNSAC